MEIAMLIIAILSLVATIAVAFVIFFLQVRLERNSRKRAEQVDEIIRKRDLESQARLFILDYQDEIEYLALAQIATVKQTARKIYPDGSGKYIHKRKFYSAFHRCETELQKEILRQAKFVDLELEKYNLFGSIRNCKDDCEKCEHKECKAAIDEVLKLLEEDAKKFGFSKQSFLYDGAKYFHRGLDRWGHTCINGHFGNDAKKTTSENSYFNLDLYDKEELKFDDPQNLEYYGESIVDHVDPMGIYSATAHNYYGAYSRNEKHDIWRRLNDYADYHKAEDKMVLHERLKNNISSLLQKNKRKTIYSYETPKKYDEFAEVCKIAPLDFYWSLVTDEEENECTYIVMEMIRQGATMINRITKKDWDISLEYSDNLIETNEDLYYATVLTLLGVYFNNIKDLHNQKLEVTNEQ